MLKSKSVLAAFFLTALLPPAAQACAVCFGSLNLNLSKAFFWGILLLLVLPFALVGLLVALVAHHTRKHQREQAALAAHRAP